MKAGGVDDIVGVLLQDGWHSVADRSFVLVENYIVSDTRFREIPGAQWLERDERRELLMACPLTAIHAVRRTMKANRPPAGTENRPVAEAGEATHEYDPFERRDDDDPFRG